jgi:hypothetical protein
MHATNNENELVLVNTTSAKSTPLSQDIIGNKKAIPSAEEGSESSIASLRSAKTPKLNNIPTNATIAAMIMPTLIALL